MTSLSGCDTLVEVDCMKRDANLELFLLDNQMKRYKYLRAHEHYHPM